MPLLSKFSKVEKNFWGNVIVWHGINSLPNPTFFRILAFSRINEVLSPYMKYLPVIGYTTDHYDLLNTLKENGGLSETGQYKTWTADHRLRTGYKTRTRSKMRTTD